MPYDTKGRVEKHYCILQDVSMVKLYQGWFEMLWSSSTCIDTPDEIDTIYNMLTEDSAEVDNELKQLADKTKQYFAA